MARNRSVIMAPDYTESNPYQQELVTALSTHDVTVILTEASLWFPLVRSWWRSDSADVLHLHWITPFIGTDRWWIAALLGFRLLMEIVVLRMLGCQIIWTIHNLTAHDARNPRVDTAVRMLTGQLSHRLIVHCERARERVDRTYSVAGKCPAEIQCIPHGHFKGSYRTDCSQNEARAELDVDTDCTLLLYFGTIRPYKNVPRLIDTFRSIDAPAARLFIVGTPWTEAIRDDVKSRCAKDRRIRHRLEFVPEDAVHRYLVACDAVVLPFDGVLTSGSAILAMSFGRALVVSDRGCPGELIEDGGGITFSPEDANGFKSALKSVIDGEHDLKSMGQRNQDVVSSFDWNDIAQRTIEVYGFEPVSTNMRLKA